MRRITWAPSTADSRQQQVIEAAKGPFYITTFRKGTKWLDPELITSAERVELFDEKTQKVFATAMVTAIKFLRFHELSSEDYFGQPDTDISADEMLMVMKRVYGEYDMNTPTTVLMLSHVELV